MLVLALEFSRDAHSTYQSQPHSSGPSSAMSPSERPNPCGVDQAGRRDTHGVSGLGPAWTRSGTLDEYTVWAPGITGNDPEGAAPSKRNSEGPTQSQ